MNVSNKKRDMQNIMQQIKVEPLDEFDQQNPSIKRYDKSEYANNNDLTTNALKFLKSDLFLNNFDEIGSMRISQTDNEHQKENINIGNFNTNHGMDNKGQIFQKPSLVSLNELLIDKNCKLFDTIFTKIVFMI